MGDTANEREDGGHQAFLLKLSDVLRTGIDEEDTATRAVRLLAEALELDRCYIASMDLAADRASVDVQYVRPGVPAVPPTIRLSDFPTPLRELLDRTTRVNDAANEPGLTALDRQSLAAIGFGAFIAAGLRHGERNPIWTLVGVSARPRRWTGDEAALMEEVAERIWATLERIRVETALRDSDVRYRSLFETMGQGYCDLELIRDSEGRAIDQRYLELNSAYERLIGIPVARARGAPRAR